MNKHFLTRIKKQLLFLLPLGISVFASCIPEGNNSTVNTGAAKAVYVLNEGSYGMNNASISRINLESGTVTNDLFATANGSPLGDTANDIIIVNDRIIIAVNGSNLIQFCDLDGKATTEVEVASPRKMTTDGFYLYVTSYANNGEVCKIDLTTQKVVATAKVGYEPEGIAVYRGMLYVANSGGYAYLGDHDYEQTISVVDASDMKVTKTIETGMYNLYGAFIQNYRYPQFILINACGDYMSKPAGSFILDCEKDEVVARYDFPATYASQFDGQIFVLGSTFSDDTNAYEYNTSCITFPNGEPENHPWRILGLEEMTSPYGLFITNTADIFVTDAGNYSDRGTIYHYDRDGQFVSKETVGVCPGHFAAR